MGGGAGLTEGDADGSGELKGVDSGDGDGDGVAVGDCGGEGVCCGEGNGSCPLKEVAGAIRASSKRQNTESTKTTKLFLKCIFKIKDEL